MVYQPYFEALECSHDGAVQVLGMRRRRPGALGHNVVASPFHGTFALQGILMRELDTGQSTQELQGCQGGVQVGLPGGDETVAHQVGGTHEHRVSRV